MRGLCGGWIFCWVGGLFVFFLCSMPRVRSCKRERRKSRRRVRSRRRGGIFRKWSFQQKPESPKPESEEVPRPLLPTRSNFEKKKDNSMLGSSMEDMRKPGELELKHRRRKSTYYVGDMSGNITRIKNVPGKGPFTAKELSSAYEKKTGYSGPILVSKEAEIIVYSGA